MSLANIRKVQPSIGVILGSGLGTVATAFGLEAEASYADIPELGCPTVPGHLGRLVMGMHRDCPILLAQGRRHIYEGLSAHEAASLVRLMHGLGVRRVIVTNSAGAIGSGLTIGGLMLIQDHINLLGESPLTGPEFHDMSQAYSSQWRERIQGVARDMGLALAEGVYAAVRGPQYETPAEIRMLRVLGADAVGMSTVPEVIQARALGMEVAGLSLITNWAAGISGSRVDHQDVLAIGAGAGAHLADLLREVW
jgi:purine-nucleoside phosphorylase